MNLQPIAAAAQGLATFQMFNVKGALTREVKLPVDAQRPTAAMLYAFAVQHSQSWLTVLQPAPGRRYRSELALHCIREAQRLHPGKIAFHFEAPVTAVNLDRQTVTVTPSKGAPQVVP